jgi:hypothetical protein
MTKIAVIVVWFLLLAMCLAMMAVPACNPPVCPVWPIWFADWYQIFFAGYTAAVVYAFCRDRNERPAEGCCRSCGYDLRGNVSGICPECGTPIPPEVKEEALRNEASPLCSNSVL